MSNDYNGPEFIVRAVQEWITVAGAKTAYIAPEVHGRTATSKASTPACPTSISPVRSSIRCRGQDHRGKLASAYNTVRPHESLGYKPPALEVFIPNFVARLSLH